MQPNTRDKLAQMGDVKANSAKLSKAIDFAKKNPDHPDAVELRRRLERGMFNVELQSLGKKPFPVQQPKIDLSKAMASVQQKPGLQTMIPEPPKQASVAGFDVDLTKKGFQERGQDVKETLYGVGEQLVTGAKEAYDIATDDDFTLAQKFMGVLGAGASAVSGAAGEVFVGAGKIALTQEAEEKLGKLVREAATAATESDIGRFVIPKVTEWYESLDKNDKLFVDSVGGMAAFMTEMFGVGKAKKPVQEAIRETAKVAEEVAPVVKEGFEQAGEAVVDTGKYVAGRTQKMLTPSAEEVAKRIDEATARIVQGTPEDIATARKALQQIDTKGVETYADLNVVISDNIKTLSRKVDTELDKYPEPIKADQLSLYQKAGQETVATTPVQDAIDGLAEAYTKSGEAVQAARVRQLRTKLDTEGLTLKEINNLAREYGIEYKDRAFSKLGDPKPGYNAESFENIRKGLKQVTRDRMPDEVTRELDSQLSSLYSTKVLTDKMETNVQKLYQKIKNRTLAQKVGGAAADIVDLATFGTLRGFVQKLLPSNVGLKTANSLDLEKELVKNLKTIERLNKIEDPEAFAKAFEKYINEDISPGMIIGSTVTPAKIGKKLTEPEFDLMADAIVDLRTARLNPDFNDMLKKHGLTNAEDDELVKFMKEATDQFETPEGSF